MISSATGHAHENGDCWPPTCPVCELEDQLEEGDE